jgi:FAD/FMN-containing dehydrogenase
MQSNNDFTLGGSISVNAHGWQPNWPPIAYTVESFRLMLADGSIVRCSRETHAELFSLALGGYGLLGIILDVDLRIGPNECYRSEHRVVPVDAFVSEFIRTVKSERHDEDVGLAYGRLCVVPGEKTFLRKAILTVFRRHGADLSGLSAQAADRKPVRRAIYRAQLGSVAGKRFRWWLETLVSENLSSSRISRNQVLNEEAGVYREYNADRTDILHEYFVPPERFADFLDRARAIVPRYKADLLNVTVRHVLEDRDTFLRYADREQYAFVMLFNQERSDAGDDDMRALTRELVDAALACEGRYYLPYRLHATPDQFARAYPQAAEFFDLKRRYDPGELFQNRFYAEYGRR